MATCSNFAHQMCWSDKGRIPEFLAHLSDTVVIAVIAVILVIIIIIRRGGVSITSHMCLICNSRIPEESVAQISNMYVCVWKRSQEFRNPALVASSNLMCQIRTCMYVSERRSQEFRNPALVCAKFEHVCMCLQGEPGILMSSLFVKSQNFLRASRVVKSNNFLRASREVKYSKIMIFISSIFYCLLYL